MKRKSSGKAKNSRDAGKIVRWLVQAVFVLSLPFFSLMVLSSSAGEMGYAVSLMVTLMIAVFLSGGAAKALLEKQNRWYLLVAAAAALYLAYAYAWQGNGVSIMQRYPEVLDALIPIRVTSKRLAAGLMLASFPSIFMLLYWLFQETWPYIRRFFKSFDAFERGYMGIAILAAVLIVPFFYRSTSAFYYAVYEDMVNLYDVLYTTDSTEVYLTDCFLRILAGPNDIRQPLFGLFALPVALVGKLVSAMFFFVPDMYAMALGMEQLILEAITIIMLQRLVDVKGKERIWFTLFLSCSYAYVIHGLMLEQYVVAYFYVILVLYVYRKTDKLNFAYFGAVSTLLTSGILFGLITKAKSLKQWVTDLLKCLAIYVGIVTVCGQLPQFLGVQDKMEMLTTFTGEKVTWAEKWAQLTQFFRDMFWAPTAETQIGDFIGYRVVNDRGVSYLGILVLVCVVCGFVLSRREWISKISMFWVLFSFLILFVVGWGTAENGLILYALYFAWAYLVLVYQFLCRIMKKPGVRHAAIVILAVTMLVRNIYELVQIYQFGVTYYPCL
ncbi:MAG: hypothetical protein J6C37_01450 [Roseburia sp.]|nr:hypothetical protein [Roseburia sp.]